LAEAHLNARALSALTEADWVIGSQRQLDTVSSLLAHQRTKKLPALTKLAQWLDDIGDNPSVTIAVLASGDPLFYGIGRWFSRRYAAEQLSYHPAVSSIQAACHLLGLSLQDVDVLSLHGRPLEKMRSHLKRHQTLLILTDKHSNPKVLAQECFNAGFDSASISVCEALGYDHQRVRQFTPAELINHTLTFDPLHITVIQTKETATVWPEFPGIPDDCFITDGESGKGMITKREVRLAILSLVQPANGDVIWDVGAGCGSVSVELARWNTRNHVYAIEHHEERLQCLEANQQRFGVVGNLTLVRGRAPGALQELPAPNKVFVGGSDGALPELLKQLWQLLPEQGVLVASAVTEATRQHLVAFYEAREQAGGTESETLQIAVSKGSRLGGQLLYRPNLPVTLFRFVKTCQDEM